MSSQRQRLLLFLGGCVLSVLGTYVMLFGNTRAASSIGGILAGMSMIFNFIQIFFQFPIKFPQDDTARESELILPPFYLQKKRQPVKLILPSSYYHALQKQQKARKDQFFKDVFNGILFWGVFLALAIPLVGILYLLAPLLPHAPSNTCIILIKQIDPPQHSGENMHYTSRFK